MRRLNLSLGMLVALVLSAAGMVTAAPAMAANVSSVYRDCETNGQLTGHYSRALLQAALNDIPSQLAEYSDCQAVIQHSLLAASRPHGGQHDNGSTTGSGAGSGPGGGGGQSGHNHSGATGTARHHSHAGSGSTDQSQGDPTVGTSNIHPASAGSATRSLPAVLVVVLILLVLTALSGGALAIRRRVAARHGT